MKKRKDRSLKRTWLNGHMTLMERSHPYNQELSHSTSMKLMFLGNKRYVCYYCGKRGDVKSLKDVHVDHIIPTRYFSPRVVMHRTCNIRRNSVLLRDDQLRTLFNSENVVRDRPRADFARAVSVACKEMMPGCQPTLAVQVLTSKISGQPIRASRAAHSRAKQHNDLAHEYEID